MAKLTTKLYFTKLERLMSKRENVLIALFSKLSELQGIPVKRNETLPQVIPKSGIAILRDGTSGEPEVLLSPPLFIYQHTAELEVIVQAVTPLERDRLLDKITEKIGLLLAEDTSLANNVDYFYPQAPEIIEEVIEGAPTMKAAIIPIVLEYIA